MKMKKYTGTHRPTTRTLEEGYVHTGNSGMTVSIKEISRYDRNQKEHHTYRLVWRHGAFGYSTVLDIPLVHPDVIDYLRDSLLRVKEHIQANPDYEPELRDRDGEVVRVEVMNGLKVENVYEERITSTHGTTTYIIARRYLEADTDKIVSQEAVYPPIPHGGSGGSSSQWRTEDIGKLVSDVKPDLEYPKFGIIMDPDTFELKTVERKEKAGRSPPGLSSKDDSI